MNAIPATAHLMEHRWGTRVALEARAELWTADGVSGFGMVRDASLSGAWVETRVRIPPLARVALQPMDRPGEWLDGCVVRSTADGIGIEWLDPGLHAVSALLSLRRESVVLLPEMAASGKVTRLPERAEQLLA